MLCFPPKKKKKMSTLTEEQRKRMEENRQKALQRRAEKSIGAPLNKIKSIQPALVLGYLRCTVMSRQRFYVDFGNSDTLLGLMKTIPGMVYDHQTKRCNFLISDHDKLMCLVKRTFPRVTIRPLHHFILKTLREATLYRVIKEYDLSVLDPFLLSSLLPFQVEGVNFGIQHFGRVLIADDMGLGKTIQAIAIASYYSADWPLLVVTPSSVRYTWKEAFHTWLPSLDKDEVAVIKSGKDRIPDNKVILISYDLLTKMKKNIVKHKFKSIIFDESHVLKNHKTARTQAFQEVILNITRILLLTGTPALSRPSELYTQISAIQSGKNFLTFKEYSKRYCDGFQTQWGWNSSGYSNLEELKILLEETVMIRRLKSEVLKQLPPKFRQTIVLDPSKISSKDKVLRSLARRIKQENLPGKEKHSLLLKYFHQTAEVKLVAVCEYVIDLLEADAKFICFAHHQSMLNGLCSCIKDRNVDYIRIDGSVPSEERKKLCDKFQEDDSCKVAVLSITSAGVGITLTAASLVVFAELYWNPGTLIQAEDRAHRIGQESSVVVQYLLAEQTADDEIWPLVQTKLDVLNRAGLSKDDFQAAEPILIDYETRPPLENFWNELDDTPELHTSDEIFRSP